MIVGSLPDVARSWAEANPALKPGYIAAYDALGDVSGGVFAVSWASLGVFGIVFSVALSRDDDFPRALTWISAASGVALAGAVAAGVGFQMSTAFALLLLGLLLSYVVLVASSVRIWVLAAGQTRKLRWSLNPSGMGRLREADGFGLDASQPAAGRPAAGRVSQSGRNRRALDRSRPATIR
jgi:hypothetical protein